MADLKHLAAAVVEAVLPAVGLAFLSAFTIAGAAMLMPDFLFSKLALTALIIWFHGVFIVAVTWKQVKQRTSWLHAILAPDWRQARC